MTAASLRLRKIELFERPVNMRMPFRFGAATVTRCVQAFVRAEADIGSRRVVGASAELMVPKWFDKSPALTHEQNTEQLRQALRGARDAYVGADAALSPWALSHDHGAAAIDRCVAQGLPRLAAQFGPAVIDKAVADLALRAHGLGWCEGLSTGLLGDPHSATLQVHRPERVALRHTVGLADRIDDGDAGTDPGDGLPATLHAAIAAYGLRYFKLKLCGDLTRDRERLSAIATLLDRQAGDYRVTLDGNETFVDVDTLGAFWRGISETPALHGLLARTLLLEQPLARAVALQQPIDRLGIGVPVILDESDDDAQVFERGIALGYRGISSKACKGIYRSLHSAARVAADPRLLLSGEDLTCQAGLAVQQDTLLAASLGVKHIERNGHHYVDGFGNAPAAEASAFAEAHAGLYSAHPPRLAVRGGELDLRSLLGTGFASAVHPDWASLQPIH